MHARILVVEDNPLQQSIIRSTLEAEGFEVETASNGLSAVWKIREGHYDLVILGYKLPELDGLAVARVTVDIMGDEARPRLVGLTAFPDGIQARELLGGKAFDTVIARWADLPTQLAPLLSSLRFARDSASKEATKVDLFLTAWDEYETAPDRLETRSNDGRSARILVVEDDETQRTVLSAALASESYVIDTAADGLSALRKMRKVGYDLALIDYELPEIDGLATAKLIIHLKGEGVRPRLVALTASPDVLKNRIGQSDRVFDEVVGKQVALPTLLEIVKKHLAFSPDRAVQQIAERSGQAA
jgi:CheY-like chemotaxis protein